jgi:hypothetical protein
MGTAERALLVVAALVALAIGVLALSGAGANRPLGPAAHTDVFQLPFTYAFPADSGLEQTQDDPDYQQWNVGGDRRLRTVAARLLGQRYVDACDPSKGTGLITGGPNEAVAYLRSAAGLSTTAPITTSVAGRTALQVDVRVVPSAACPLVSLWPQVGTFSDRFLPDWTVRFTFVEVGQQLIGLIALAPEMEAWAPTYDAFLQSVVFDADRATSRASPP